MEVRTADFYSIQSVIELIDDCFIISKNRTGSVKERYPDVFNEKNYDQIFILSEKDIILSTISCKTIEIQDFHDQSFTVFIVGFVATRSNYQGKGYSTILLKHAAQIFFQKGYNFGLLWTTIQPFYKRFGWIDTDPEALLSCKDLKIESSLKSVKLFTQIQEKDEAIIKAFGKRHFGYSFLSAEEWLTKVRFTAIDESGFYVYRNNDLLEGLVYFGINSKTCFIPFILFNNLNTLKILINQLASEFKTTCFKFNLPLGSFILKDIQDVFEFSELETKQLGMMLLNERAGTSVNPRTLYIPFQCRI